MASWVRRGLVTLRGAWPGACESVVDLIYPKRCATCLERGAWVCPQCEPNLDLFQSPLCAGCGVPVANGCHCSAMPPALSQIRSVGPFASWLRDSILLFKYEDEWARADDLGRHLARVVADMHSVDALVPVPLHQTRLRDRGYNQSALLAGVVGKQLGLPVVAAVERTRATAQQARLVGADRAANVDGAFAVSGAAQTAVAGARLVLIDDVITTGATLDACARALLAGGAAIVSAATLARQV